AAAYPLGAQRDNAANPGAERHSVGPLARRGNAVAARPHAIARPGDLSARRYLDQGRSCQHGGGAGGTRATARSPGGRICLGAAAVGENTWRQEQVAAAAGALPPCSTGAGRAPEDGLRNSARRVAARAASGLGGNAAGGKA